MKLLVNKWVDTECQERYDDLCPMCGIPFQQNQTINTKVEHTNQKCPHSMKELLDYLRCYKTTLAVTDGVTKETSAILKKKPQIDWKAKLKALDNYKKTFTDKFGFVCPICKEIYKKGQTYCSCGPVVILEWFQKKQQHYYLRLLIQREINLALSELKKCAMTPNTPTQ